MQRRGPGRNQSTRNFVKKTIERTIDQGGETKKAHERLAERRQNAKDIGLKGKIAWTRSDP